MIRKTITITQYLSLIIFSCSAYQAKSQNPLPAFGFSALPMQVCETAPWEFYWGDEFNGTSPDPSKWKTYSNNGGDCYYSNTDDCLQSRYDAQGYVILKDENVRVSGGHCTLTVKKDISLWHGMLTTHSSGILCTPNQSDPAKRVLFNRGRFEARIKFCGAENVWSTFWIWGNSKWGKTSEIDIAEYNGSHNKDMTSSLHNFPDNFYWDDTYTHKKQIGGTIIPYYLDWSENFHVYAVEWDEHFVRFFIDGTFIHEQSRFFNSSCILPPDNYMYKLGFPDIDEYGSINFTLQLKLPLLKVDSCHTIIDWVRVYKRKNCEEDITITSPNLFPFEQLTKRNILLGTLTEIPWSNIIPEWGRGHYQARSITMLPNFLSMGTVNTHDPSATNSFLYEAITCVFHSDISTQEPSAPPTYNTQNITSANTINTGLQKALGMPPLSEKQDQHLLNIESTPSHNISIVPNPNNGTFNVSGDFTGEVNIRIYNCTGALVAQRKSDGSRVVEIKELLQTGIYTAIINYKGAIYRKKITIL